MKFLSLFGPEWALVAICLNLNRLHSSSDPAVGRELLAGYLTGMAINANIDKLPVAFVDIYRNPYVQAGSKAYGVLSGLAKCGFCDDDVMNWCNYRPNFRKACKYIR